MHYENGREIKVGDWAVGPTHNSKGCIRVGLVTELMPKQGPCNVKLKVWIGHYFHDDGGSDHYIRAEETRGRDDFADSIKLVHVLDAYRMIHAVASQGHWQAPYYEPRFGM